MTRDDFETLFSYLDADNSGACENTHKHSFSLSLSLSLTHTHTHTQNIHKHTHPVCLSLTLTQKNTHRRFRMGFRLGGIHNGGEAGERDIDIECVLIECVLYTCHLDWAECTMVAKQASVT